MWMERECQQSDSLADGQAARHRPEQVDAFGAAAVRSGPTRSTATPAAAAPALLVSVGVSVGWREGAGRFGRASGQRKAVADKCLGLARGHRKAVNRQVSHRADPRWRAWRSVRSSCSRTTGRCQPVARLPFGRRTLSTPVETPTQGRRGGAAE